MEREGCVDLDSFTWELASNLQSDLAGINVFTDFVLGGCVGIAT